MKINCLIVDDEPRAVEELKNILFRMDHVAIVGVAFSVENAIDAIKNKRPDLVFLDINMPGRDGFEVVKACSEMPDPPFFVFATAYDEHVVETFKASALDYILKPFQPGHVQESVEGVKQMMMSRHHRRLHGYPENLVLRIPSSPNYLAKIGVKHKGRIRLLHPESIVFCKAENKATLAYTETQCHPLHGAVRLKILEAKLTGRGFFKSHRSYLVNLAYIKELITWFNGKYILTMADQQKSEVPVSRRKVKSLKQRLVLLKV